MTNAEEKAIRKIDEFIDDMVKFRELIIALLEKSKPEFTDEEWYAICEVLCDKIDEGHDDVKRGLDAMADALTW